MTITSSAARRPGRRAPLAVLAVLGMLGLSAVGAPASPVDAAATSVAVAGSLQSELGCPDDWLPDCADSELTLEADDGVWQATFAVPAGGWEYKAALDDSWEENYGLGAERDGANIPLTLAADGDVRFYYDDTSHWATDDVNSVIATVPGSFQSELGCGADWDPACLRSWLQDPDGDGIGRFATTALPPGDYEAKVAIDEAWDENYGVDGVPDGPNLTFTVTTLGDSVLFAYDQTSHVLTIDVVPVTPVDDAALVREPVRHPFADEILYFTIPDRFDDGDPSNNCGDFTGDCVADGPEVDVLTHGYLPSNKGYYHGGDLIGLRDKLPYLQKLGVTAIWVGPIFENKVVQPDSTSLYGASAGYHGYWILDFLQVDPHLGTNRDFERLVDDAHRRGIKVFMDVVTNHTADVVQLDGNAGYRNKSTFPYLDTSGQPFDDSEFAYAGQPDHSFPPVDVSSFPYTPLVPAGEESAKNPAWLNDPLLYHNRGDTSFTGENSLYGDFFGLDDLWTERREVVDGMVDIFSWWIEEFEVDGFRIDTTKHVNIEFWQVFGPAILDKAEAEGIDDFFAFGEVFDQNVGPPFLSHFSTEGHLQSTIDFSFQLAARDFASRSAATDNLRTFFESDDYYTDTDSNAYAMPTFLGNHDMGRIGYFLQQDQPGAPDDELLARSQLAHALMFLARGQPVVYYGDEQGFTGDGGDKDAREDLFANSVDVYEDNDLIGTDATTSDDNFDRKHPLYRYIGELAKLYRKHRTLRTGAQIHRYSSDGPGIYAFSRIDRDAGHEYVVALNNSTAEATATIPVYGPGDRARFRLVSNQLTPPGSVDRVVPVASDGTIELTVPPLRAVVYRSDEKAPRSKAAPGIELTTLQSGQVIPLEQNSWDGHLVRDRIEVGVRLETDARAEVTFAVRVGNGDYEPIGTDDNAPYRVFYDASGLEGTDTTLSFRAIVDDLSGNLASDEVVGVRPEFPAPGGPATAYAVVHYLRDDGEYGDGGEPWGLHLWGDAIVPGELTDWASPKTFDGEDDYGRFAWVELADDSRPVNFIVHQGDVKDPADSPDRSFIPADTTEIWLRQGDSTVHESRAEAQGYAEVHYGCDGGCAGVTLEATNADGPLLAGAAPEAVDDYGAVWRLTPTDLSDEVTVTVNVGGTADVADQTFVPTEVPAAWLQPGDQTLHPSQGAATDTATVHYRRADGDYGDPTSTDFNDFWGLHTWTGAAAPTEWTAPERPVGTDRFGAVFEVDLVDGADQLAYILHRGDTKDPGPDQFLLFDRWAHEVWQLEGADPERPYVAPPAPGP